MYDMPDFSFCEWDRIERLAREDPEAKILVFLYYKGHANVLNGCINYVGEDGEDQSNQVETYLRACATFPNVYSVGLWDCCRRVTGRGGLYTPLSETHNLVCVYREEMTTTPYRQKVCPCDPCEPINLAKDFFKHLKTLK